MSATLIMAGILAAAVLSVYILLVYAFLVRPWHLRWGATDEEVKRSMPGDKLVPHPREKVTRAITIKARAADVWPWLVQMGQGRGGFYSYEKIENIFGLNIKNADRIIPELQDLGVGDTLPIEPGGVGFVVVSIEPRRSLVLHNTVDTRTRRTLSPDETVPDYYFSSSWVFLLDELDEKSTRLVVRSRLDWTPGFMNTLGYRIFVEPAHFIMERKMLLGIKRRAERLASRNDIPN